MLAQRIVCRSFAWACVVGRCANLILGWIRSDKIDDVCSRVSNRVVRVMQSMSRSFECRIALLSVEVLIGVKVRSTVKLTIEFASKFDVRGGSG